jgi:hypothetical protein
MDKTNSKLRYARFLLQYCNPAALPSLWISIRNKGDTPMDQKHFYQNGGKSRTAQKAKYKWANLPLQLQTRFVTHKIEDHIEEGIADMRKIIDLCTARGVRLIVFTTPLHIAEYELFVEHGYIRFLEKLSDITNFYNFVGINDIAVNNDCFDDVFHHNITIGDMVIDTIFNGVTDEHLLSQGFGIFVTPENRDAFFALLRDQESRIRGEHR